MDVKALNALLDEAMAPTQAASKNFVSKFTFGQWTRHYHNQANNALVAKEAAMDSKAMTGWKWQGTQAA